MKRILFFIAFLFTAFIGHSQVYQVIKTPYAYDKAGGTKVSIIARDTVLGPKDSAYALIASIEGVLYLFDSTVQKTWILVETGGSQTIDEVLTEGNYSTLAARLGGLDFQPNGYFRFPARGSDDPFSTPEGTVYYDSTGNNFRGQQGTIFYNFLTSAIVSTDTALGVSNVLLPTQRAVYQHIQNRLDDYVAIASFDDLMDDYGYFTDSATGVKVRSAVVPGTGDTLYIDTLYRIATKNWVLAQGYGTSSYGNEDVDDRVAVLIQNGTGISWSYNDASGTLTPTVSLASFSTTNLSEGTNLYYTDARARASISLTTTGTSGAATYNSSTGVLNIPQYSGGSSYTFTNAITESSGTVKLGGALTEATTITNTNTFTFSLLNNTDAASVLVAKLEGDRATMADNDEAYLSLMLSNDAGTQTEFGRFSWVATDVNAGTSVDGRINIGVTVAGTLASEWSIDGTALFPYTDGGADIGKSTLGVNNIHVNTGGDVTWENGDVRISHASNQLYFIGAASNYIFDGTIRLSTSGSADLGSGSFQWNNLYVNSSVNFSNGDVTITRTSNLLTVAGGDFAVPTEVYGIGWDGSNEVPTKDAIYDKIESLAGGGATTLDGLTDVVITAAATGDILYYNGTNWVDQAVATVAISGAYSDLTGKPTIPTITWGTDGQLPFMNAGGTDFIYSSSYTYNSTTGNLKVANGFIAGDGKLYMNASDLTDNYFDFNNDAAGRFTLKNLDGDISLYAGGTNAIYFIKNTTVAMAISSGANPYVGIGTIGPDRYLHVEQGDGTLNAITYVSRFTHYTSAGTVATGFGVGHEFELENASGTNRIAGEFTFSWTDATNATEDAEWKLRLMKAGTIADAMTVSSDGYLNLPSLSSAGDRILFANSSGTVTTGSLGNGMQNSGSELSTKSYHLNTNTTDYGNVGTGEDNLEVYPVDANTLDVDGKSIIGIYYFTTASNANSKTITLYFGADQLAQFTSLSSSNSYKAIVTITRTGAATQEVSVEWINSTTGATSVVITTATRTLSASNDLKFTATATADNDVVQKISHKNITTNN